MGNKKVLQAAAAVAATLGGALAAAPALGSAETPAAANAATKKVIVMDNFFEPRYLEIHKGERVVWVWKGDNSHNIVFTKVPKQASKKGASSRRDGRWSRKFKRRGLYKYVCTLHSGQRGSIEVLKAEPPTTSAQ
jgi:plastocyanin